MKQAIVIIIILFSVINTVKAQQATKTLDYIKTKDGKQLYGKVKSIDPKEGVTFQTYGEGEELKFKHEEIETIKLASLKKEIDKKVKSKGTFFSGIGFNSNVFTKQLQYIDTNSVYDVDFNTFGGYFSINMLSSSEKVLNSISLGFEKGYNYSLVPLSQNIKINKTLGEKNKLSIGFGYNILFSNQRVYKIQNTNDLNEWQNDYASHINIGIGGNAGIGIIHKINDKLRLLFDVNYQISARNQYYYTFDSSYGYDDRASYSAFQNLSLRLGILFK